MIRLTEEMVIARTRVSDLNSITKLNCWGVDLEDVSLLKRMPNVVVLALSVNSIKTLADFQKCYSLQELYIRKNKITDLRDVCYLKGLPNLKSLWLAENPCTQVDGYRLSVIRALPQLQKLDDTEITHDERNEANRSGIELSLPLQGQESIPASPVPSPVEPVPSNVTPISEDLQRVPDYQSLNTRSRSVTPQLTDQEESPRSKPPTEQIVTHQNTPDATPQRRKASTPLTQTPSPQHVHYASESLPSSRRASTASFSSLQNAEYSVPEYSFEAVKEYKCAVHSGTQTEIPSLETSKSQAPPPSAFRTYNYPPATPAPHSNDHFGTYQEQRVAADPRSQLHFSDNYHRHSQFSAVPPAHAAPPSYPPQNQGTNSEKSSPTRSRNRTKTSNLLMATLCLVNELDYGSLEVVAMAVRNRLDELDES